MTSLHPFLFHCSFVSFLCFSSQIRTAKHSRVCSVSNLSNDSLCSVKRVSLAGLCFREQLVVHCEVCGCAVSDAPSTCFVPLSVQPPSVLLAVSLCRQLVSLCRSSVSCYSCRSCMAKDTSVQRRCTGRDCGTSSQRKTGSSLLISARTQASWKQKQERMASPQAS